MDGECLKLNLNSHLLKAAKRGGRRVGDRISELPDEIIVIILSFLSVKEAAATSILSRRWRNNLWKHTHNLNFSSEILNLNNSNNLQEEESSWDADSCQYVKLVNSVLHSHRPPYLKLFRVSFYVNRSAQAQVEEWLDFLLSTRVESLELEFKCWREVYNKVVLGAYLLERQSSDIILFKSIEKLSLKCFQLSGEDIKMLLHNCPLLKILIINTATLTSDVEIGGANLMLEELEMYSCFGRKCIKVSAPNLTWVRVDDYTSRKLMFENVGKLCRARFLIRRPEYVAPHFASQVSCFISQLRSLVLSLHHPKEFLGKEFPQMPNLRKLGVFEFFGDNEHGGLLHLAPLIWASPRLQEFYLKFVGECNDSAVLPYMEADEAIKNFKRNPHQNLKTFKFRGCCRGVSDGVVELVTYITKNCCALGKIIIGRPLKVSSDMGAEVEARDSIKLQLQPKLRRHILLQIAQPI